MHIVFILCVSALTQVIINFHLPSNTRLKITVFFVCTNGEKKATEVHSPLFTCSHAQIQATSNKQQVELKSETGTS